MSPYRGADGGSGNAGQPARAQFQPEWGARTYIMGILNVTPDSFSGDGILDLPSAAAARVASQLRDGADIVDIGGESTRPGFTPVTAEEELRRVLPAVRAAVRHGAGPLAIDTRKATVASQAVAARAAMINDVSGLADDEMARVAARSGAWLVVAHSRPPDGSEDLMRFICRGLDAVAQRAIAAGVPEDRLIVDPGLGFRKNWRHNFEILRRLHEIKSLGLPVMIGPSRKGMIGRVLGTEPQDRMEGTAALCVIGIANGADMLRVHDVLQMVRVARMTDALVRGT